MGWRMILGSPCATSHSKFMLKLPSRSWGRSISQLTQGSLTAVSNLTTPDSGSSLSGFRKPHQRASRSPISWPCQILKTSSGVDSKISADIHHGGGAIYQIHGHQDIERSYPVSHAHGARAGTILETLQRKKWNRRALTSYR